jgi:hypothetical protein
MRPNVLAEQACKHDWTTDITERPIGPVVTLQRDTWRLKVVFDGNAPQAATLTGPGYEGRRLNLRAINPLVRTSPDEIVHVATTVTGRPAATTNA